MKLIVILTSSLLFLSSCSIYVSQQDLELERYNSMCAAFSLQSDQVALKIEKGELSDSIIPKVESIVNETAPICKDTSSLPSNWQYNELIISNNTQKLFDLQSGK